MAYFKKPYQKHVMVLGAFLGLVGIILAALGTHQIRPKISPQSYHTFEIGLQIQMYHALLAIIVGALSCFARNFYKYFFYILFLGVCLFCGAVYTVATIDITKILLGYFIYCAPVGGALLILSWLLLVINVFKIR